MPFAQPHSFFEHLDHPTNPTPFKEPNMQKCTKMSKWLKGDIYISVFPNNKPHALPSVNRILNRPNDNLYQLKIVASVRGEGHLHKSLAGER
ncbi:hypothetical protein CEXT_787701 [Caerostris extrusa]|uniref:Uncharacterized protein n=1 Tax=Caerostris extrusa TaxID=172846 RepID=A0AAV4NWC2_CAEEX|nr:hypothetical protein CEXT_787701 [Caerostris extrusa]